MTVCVLLLLACAGLGAASSAVSLVQTLPDKASRTPAQQKIDSQLLAEVFRKQGKSLEKNDRPGKASLRIDARGRALVDVRAEVSESLQQKIRDLGGAIDATSAEFRSIVAWVPLLKLEQLAGESAVISIIAKPEAVIR